jgi:hypothetical protein
VKAVLLLRTDAIIDCLSVHYSRKHIIKKFWEFLMNGISYLPFDLLITRYDNHYRARLLTSPVGQALNDFVLPESEEEFFEDLLDDKALLTEFGRQLFEAIFDGELLSSYRRSLDQAKVQGYRGIRLLLRLAEVPELNSIPWEYLYDKSRQRFICLSSETSLARYLDLPETEKPLLVKPPLKILTLLSNPNGYPPLDVEGEWETLNDALGELVKEGLITLTRLDKATLPALHQQLIEETYHIFHFIGHGLFDEESESGMLILETEDGWEHPVSGLVIGNLLHDKSLRLVFLNACEAARTSAKNAFTGVAATLLQQGIPSVVAMQSALTDEAAITFASHFYRAIAASYSVDAAITEGRRAIYYQNNQTEWGTPVLYMRAPHGRIFDVGQASLPPDTLVNFQPQQDNCEERYLDAAMPKQVMVGQSTELVILIRLPDSKGLGGLLKQEPDFDAQPEDVKSSGFDLRFPLDESGLPLGLWIDVETDDFDLPIRRKKIQIQYGEDSSLCIFRLTPLKTGTLSLIVQVSISDEMQIGSGLLKVTGLTKLRQQVHSFIKLISVSLGTFGLPIAKAVDIARDYDYYWSEEGNDVGAIAEAASALESIPLLSPPPPASMMAGASQKYQRQIEEIAEKLTQRRLAFFLGADLPQSITGVESRGAVAAKLSNRYNIEPGKSLATVAQLVMNHGNRHDFTQFLLDRLQLCAPHPFYDLIAQLIKKGQPEWIITTAYHRLLAKSLQNNQCPSNTVVNDSNLSFINPNQPTILKLYGDIQQPTSLVVTEQDQNKLLRGRFPDKRDMVDEIRRLFRRNSILFIGYELSDPSVSAFFDEVAGDRFQSSSYAVCSGLSPLAVNSFESNRGLKILPGDPMAVVQHLLALVDLPSPSPHPLTASASPNFGRGSALTP